MIEQVCRYCNYWPVSFSETGQYSSSGGTVTLRGAYKPGQYVKIGRSDLVDGLYKVSSVNGQDYTLEGLADDSGKWLISGLKLPPAFLDICAEVKDFLSSPAGKPSVYQSESFGVYSYTKAQNAKGQPSTWQDLFAAKLAPYKKGSWV